MSFRSLITVAAATSMLAMAPRNGDAQTPIPEPVVFHLAKLVEAQRNYAGHVRTLASLHIAPATERADAATAENVCLALERDATMLELHAEALAVAAPAFDRWLTPLRERARSARGTLMAMREVLANGSPVERKREALGVARSLRSANREVELLLAALKQDLGVTTS